MENKVKNGLNGAQQRELILHDVLSKTSLKQFNKAINNYDVQSIYERHYNYLAHKYFGGDRLECSVYMRELFNEFLPTRIEQEQKEIHLQLKRLKKEIRLRRKNKQPCNDLILEHNDYVIVHNWLNKGIKELTKIYKGIKDGI